MKLNKNIAISETGYIFNPLTGETFVVNQSGMEILNLLKKSYNQQEIQNQLAKEYLIDYNDIEKDLNNFIDFLMRYDLLEK